MTRTRIARTVATPGLAGVLVLTACGAPTPQAAAPVAEVAADLADEAYALRAVGLTTGLEPAPTPSESARPAGRGKRQAARRYLHDNTLHGEITVQGKDGPRTVVVQRGTVTAVTPGQVGVKSADGFTLTWTFGAGMRVVQDRERVDAGAVRVGAQIGVAGRREGSATSARLIVLP